MNHIHTTVTIIGWIGTVAGTAMTLWNWRRALFHRRRADRFEARFHYTAKAAGEFRKLYLTEKSRNQAASRGMDAGKAS